MENLKQRKIAISANEKIEEHQQIKKWRNRKTEQLKIEKLQMRKFVKSKNCKLRNRKIKTENLKNRKSIEKLCATRG